MKLRIRSGRRLLAAVAGASLLLALAGCASAKMPPVEELPPEEAPAEGGQTPAVVEPNLVDGLFAIGDFEVVKYRIRGEGEDGAWFDWIEADTPRIAIADIRRGQWTIYAQGLNKDGVPVVQGKVETFLCEDSPIDNLVFDEGYAVGDARCGLAWNTAQVLHPGIEVYIRRPGGDYMACDAREVAISLADSS